MCKELWDWKNVEDGYGISKEGWDGQEGIVINEGCDL